MVRRYILLTLSLLWPLAAADSIRIVVLEGDGAVNNIRFERAREPVIKVESEDGEPVSGAVVHFLAPSVGPGGVFLDGSANATLQTDDQGRATARGFRPNKNAGQFVIRVTASYLGKSANARITQTNAEPAGASRNSSRKIAILAIVGGAVAGGAALAARGGGGGSKTTSPGTVITAGSPTFGAP
jgi:hypothetical protein